MLARTLVSSHSLLGYLWRMLWPKGLMHYYPYPRAISVVSYDYFLAPFLVIIITAICFFSRKQKIWLAAWSYYVITLLPVLGVVQVGMQRMADRYFYLPSLGPFLLFGIGAVLAYRKVLKVLSLNWSTNAVKILFGLLGTALVITLSTLTLKQIHIWKNGITLWTAAIERNSGVNLQDFQAPYRTFVARGTLFEKQGRFAEALKDYETAAEYQPSSTLYASCGLMYTKLGKLKDALRAYTRAIGVPNTRPDIYYDRGNINVQFGRLKEAISDYTRAIKLSAEPRFKYYNNRGLTYQLMGMRKESEEDFVWADVLKKQWTEVKWSYLMRNPLAASDANSIDNFLNGL